VQRDPSYANLVSYSVELVQAGRSIEAIQVCDRALKLKPADPIALNNRATAQLQLGEVGQAEKSLSLALKAAPDFALAKSNLAWAARSRHALEASMAAMKKQLPKSTGKDRNDLLFKMGSVQYLLGQYTESNKTYARLIKADAKNASAHNNVGMNQMLLEHYADAASAFKRAADLDPKTPLYANNLKWAMDMQKAAPGAPGNS